MIESLVQCQRRRSEIIPLRASSTTPAQHTEKLAMSSSRVSQSLTGPLLVRAEAVASAVQASAVSDGPRSAPAPLCRLGGRPQEAGNALEPCQHPESVALQLACAIDLPTAASASNTSRFTPFDVRSRGWGHRGDSHAGNEEKKKKHILDLAQLDSGQDQAPISAGHLRPSHR